MAEAMSLVEPRVCLADTAGELVSARALLNELGIAWCDYDPARDGLADLLISTPQVALGNSRVRSQAGARTHIVVGQNVSRTLRKELERHPCEFVVEMPIEPTAFRALIEHAIYRGPERRRGLRAMIGGEVKLKAGFWTKKATLMQLSERGCGVLLEQPLSPEEVTLRLPTAWTDGHKVELRARLLDQHMQAGEGNLASFAFTKLDVATRKRLRQIMKSQARHGSLMQPGGHGVADPQSSKQKPPETSPSQAAEKRRSTRKPFEKQILATLRGQAQAVTSRDISAGGMRLAPDPEISEGDELKLALYGGKGTPPLMLRGIVVHADDARGLGLEFVDIPERMQERLDAIVNDSPISGPVDATSGRSKVVVTEIVDRVGSDEG